LISVRVEAIPRELGRFEENRVLMAHRLFV